MKNFSVDLLTMASSHELSEMTESSEEEIVNRIAAAETGIESFIAAVECLGWRLIDETDEARADMGSTFSDFLQAYFENERDDYEPDADDEEEEEEEEEEEDYEEED